MSFLKVWFLVTAALLAAGLMWAFAPILIPVFLVAALLGVIVWAVIAVARRIEARRAPPARDPSEDKR